MFGSMSVLAPQILEIVETKTLLGKSPHDMFDADPDYWLHVGDYGRCEIIKNGTDCVEHLEKAKTRAWEQALEEEKDFQTTVDASPVSYKILMHSKI